MLKLPLIVPDPLTNAALYPSVAVALTPSFVSDAFSACTALLNSSSFVVEVSAFCVVSSICSVVRSTSDLRVLTSISSTTPPGLSHRCCTDGPRNVSNSKKYSRKR
jgi:hypothetical protein